MHVSSTLSLEPEDLTLTGKYAIARSRPVGMILKLKFNSFRITAAYECDYGHYTAEFGTSRPALQFHVHTKIG